MKTLSLFLLSLVLTAQLAWTEELSPYEEAYVSCAADCVQKHDIEGALGQCLLVCRERNQLDYESVSKFFSFKVGIGISEEDCNKHTAGFVCPDPGTNCCCSGWFDCQKMQKMISNCKIDHCKKVGDNPEICSCEYATTD